MILDSLKQAPMALWMFVIIGLLAAVGILISVEFRDSTDSTDGFTISNETVAGAAAGTNLAVTSLSAPSGLLFSNATEGNDPTVVNSSSVIVNTTGTANGDNSLTYTVYIDDNLIPSMEGVDINITYTGAQYNDAGNVIQNSTRGISNITKQLPTVGTVIGVLIIVSAVMGLVGVFSFFRKKEGGMY